MMRCLMIIYVEAFHEFTLGCVHVPGAANTAADTLSRNALTSFFVQVPEADPDPLHIPPAAGGGPAQRGHRLANAGLEGAVRYYILYADLAESTRRTYAAGMRRFYELFPPPFRLPKSRCATSPQRWRMTTSRRRQSKHTWPLSAMRI